jgi:hypothetical protein
METARAQSTVTSLLFIASLPWACMENPIVLFILENPDLNLTMPAIIELYNAGLITDSRMRPIMDWEGPKAPVWQLKVIKFARALPRFRALPDDAGRRVATGRPSRAHSLGSSKRSGKGPFREPESRFRPAGGMRTPRHKINPATRCVARHATLSAYTPPARVSNNLRSQASYFVSIFTARNSPVFSSSSVIRMSQSSFG